MRFTALFAALILLALVPPARANDETLTNRDIIDMVKAGLGANLVTTKIASSETVFDMSPRAMIELKNSNVPDQIIELMLQEFMKNQKKMRARIAVEIQNLASGNPEVQRKAFAYLRKIDTAALAQLNEGLASSSPEIRAASARALGDLGDKEAASALRELLADPQQPVRFAAAHSLALLLDQAALEMAQKSVAGGINPVDGYIRLLGLRKSTDYLGFVAMRLLKDTDPATRAQAAWALGEIGDSRGVAPLEEALLNDREAAVKKECANALGNIAAESSLEKLMDVCRRVPGVRRECLMAIGRYPAKLAVPFLVTSLGQSLTAEEQLEVLNALRRLTARDFGEDVAEWNKWLAENRDSLANEVNPNLR